MIRQVGRYLLAAVTMVLVGLAVPLILVAMMITDLVHDGEEPME